MWGCGGGGYGGYISSDDQWVSLAGGGYGVDMVSGVVCLGAGGYPKSHGIPTPSGTAT